MHPVWARELRDLCKEEGTAFFFKQWGSWAPMAGKRSVLLSNNGQIVLGASDAKTDVVEMSRVKRSVAGRRLDGRTWDEMPEADSILV